MLKGGYSGKLLYVDLTAGRVSEENLSRELAIKFIGGPGINTRLAVDLIRHNIDPLSEENVVLIGAGPLIGTNTPGTSKTIATTKLPVTGSLATMTGGGAFARALKYCGYDHLVISGRAKSPSYLEILDDKVKVCDGNGLWGKGLHEVTDILYTKYSKMSYGTSCSVLVIGPAGENLVASALTQIDKSTGHLGRGGLGAVLGSKNLKAIVVRGTKGIKVADPKGFMDLTLPIIERTRIDPVREEYTKVGAAIAIEAWAACGMLYRHNYRDAIKLDELSRRFPTAHYLELKKSSMGCPSCPYQCKSLLEIKEGEFAGVYPINEYLLAIEMAAAWIDGTPEKGIKFVSDADDYGIDAYQVNGVMEVLCELYEKGITSKDEIDGLTPEATFSFAMETLHRMTKGEGIFGALGSGPNGLLEKFGDKAKPYVLSLKGHFPQLEPRANLGAAAWGQLTNPRGHQGPVMLTIIPGRSERGLRRYLARIGASEEAINRIFSLEGFNVAIDTKYTEDWLYLLNCLGVCRREAITRWYTLDSLSALYKTATGLDVTATDLIRAGERTFNLERVYNVEEGFGIKDDQFPDRMLDETLKHGDQNLPLMDYYKQKVLTREDMAQLLRDYYVERDWDPETGRPKEEKLKSLGLSREARSPKKKSSKRA